MTDPGSRGWGPGYPNCQAGNMKTIVRPDGLRLPVHKGIAPIVAWLLDETERRGYDVKPGQTWGFACRSIRGYPKRPSWHSWGLSIDINAPSNPMLAGAPGWQALHNSGRTDMPQWMPGLWNAHMFRWGGDYSHRQDAMHYEFMGTPADAARIAGELHAGPGATRPGLPLKLSSPPMKSATGEDVQRLVNGWILKHKIDLPLLKVDGVYGKTSAGHIVAFKKWVIGIQRAFRLPVWPNADSYVGPVTYGGLRYWNSH